MNVEDILRLLGYTLILLGVGVLVLGVYVWCSHVWMRRNVVVMRGSSLLSQTKTRCLQVWRAALVFVRSARNGFWR